MYIRKLKSHQAGDTIVEVLIAIAVVSAVLGTAYAIVNVAIQTSQQSQEYSRALGVAETQLERLKPNAAAKTQTQSFCIKEDNSIDIVTPCKFSDGSAIDRWQVSVSRDASTGIFTVTVNWEGPKSSQENVNLYYRDY